MKISSIFVGGFLFFSAGLLGCASSSDEAGHSESAADPSSDYAAGSQHPSGGDYSHASDASGGGNGYSEWDESAPTASAADAGGLSEGDEAPAQSWKKNVDNIQFASVTVGGGETLDLVDMRVTVYVEGLRARTVVDHIYYNPHGQGLEGTFRYSLPTEANVSYYSMFVGQDAVEPEFFGPADDLDDLDVGALASERPDLVAKSADPSLWGELREAQVVRSVDALKTYEDVTAQKIDPALVEEVSPNTFEARVFPIPAQGYNRVIVAYEQTLPRIGDALEYTFPVAGGAIGSLDFTFAAGGDVTEVSYEGDLDGVYPVISEALDDTSLQVSDEDSDALVYQMHAAGQTTAAYLVFHARTAETNSEAEVLVGSDPTRNEDYFYARIHPTAQSWPQEPNDTGEAVFMIDTSLSEQPGQFAVNVQLLEGILAGSPQIERFNVLTFDAGARWLSNKWFDNTAANRQTVLDTMDDILLEGATDFDAALRTLRKPPMTMKNVDRVDVFVLSDGVITWGDTTADAMVARHVSSSSFDGRFFVYRTGIGAENLALFSALTRRGAIFNCFTQDSVDACSTAHHYAGIQITDLFVEGMGETPAAVSDLLVAGRQATLFPNSTLTVAGKIATAGDAILRIHGAVNDTAVDIEVPLTLQPTGSLAPRAWAEIAITQLLASRDEELEGMAMALSQHFRVVNRIASFIVLETDEEYDFYDLDIEGEELGDVDIAALVQAAMAALGAPITSWDKILEVFDDYASMNKVLDLEGGKLVDTLVDLASDDGLELPTADLEIPLVKKSDVPSNYRKQVSYEPWEVDLYADEGKRRLNAGETGAAVRALSSVIENNPGSSELSRMVGYQLGAWELEDVASPLFLQVLQKRPFEPQSYRDLANSLGLSRPALSAMMFEAVLAGQWHAKFGSFKTVVAEEYALLITGAQQSGISSQLASYLNGRSKKLGLPTPTGEMRVTLTWNTNNTDIDLWVTDPSGEKCFYSNKELASGGKLLEDLTQGYGPERFVADKAQSGTYKVQVHYYGNNGNKLFAKTFVTLTIMKYVGTSQETIERHLVELDQVDDVVTIAKVKFP